MIDERPHSVAASARDRILNASCELFGRQGYTGTGIKEILSASRSSFGSLYHFFPQGKEQLGVEAIRREGYRYIDRFVAISTHEDRAATVVGRFFDDAADRLQRSNYADASPISAVALEVANASEPLRQATADAFSGWMDVASEYFVALGIEPTTSRALSVSILSLMEGALVLARATRCIEPLNFARATAETAIEASAIATAGRRGRPDECRRDRAAPADG